MTKTDRALTEANEMTERLCDSVAGSGAYMLKGGPQMQVEVMRGLLADLAKDGGDWRRIYGFIYKFWHTRRPLFPDVDTMAGMIAKKSNSTKRKPS